METSTAVNTMETLKACKTVKTLSIHTKLMKTCKHTIKTYKYKLKVMALFWKQKNKTNKSRYWALVCKVFIE